MFFSYLFIFFVSSEHSSVVHSFVAYQEMVSPVVLILQFLLGGKPLLAALYWREVKNDCPL